MYCRTIPKNLKQQYLFSYLCGPPHLCARESNLCGIIEQPLIPWLLFICHHCISHLVTNCSSHYIHHFVQPHFNLAIITIPQFRNHWFRFLGPICLEIWRTCPVQAHWSVNGTYSSSPLYIPNPCFVGFPLSSSSNCSLAMLSNSLAKWRHTWSIICVKVTRFQLTASKSIKETENGQSWTKTVQRFNNIGTD